MVRAAKFKRGLVETLGDLSIPPITLLAPHLLMHCPCRICNNTGKPAIGVLHSYKKSFLEGRGNNQQSVNG